MCHLGRLKPYSRSELDLSRGIRYVVCWLQQCIDAKATAWFSNRMCALNDKCRRLCTSPSTHDVSVWLCASIVEELV